MIAISIILLAIANLSMAAYHSTLMKRGKKIKHGLWAIAYFLFAVILSLINHSWLLFIDALLIRKVVFDLFLNCFNNRPIFFVSTETTSIIDEFHLKLFGKKSWIYYILYSIAAIVITVLL